MTLQIKVNSQDIDSWNENGFLFIKGNKIFDSETRKRIISEVDDMDNWVDQVGKSFFYYEENMDPSRAKVLNRIEYFLIIPDIFPLFSEVRISLILSHHYADNHLFYKEKVNYKYPNTSGFEPHQDAQAGWGAHGHTFHLSVGFNRSKH